MQTIDFLRDVLPSSGWYYAAQREQRTDRHGRPFWMWVNTPCDTVDDLAGAVQRADRMKQDAYYALASFHKRTYQVTTPRGHTKTRSRTQDNAKTLKAFWLDIDCGPAKPYTTQKDALQAIKPVFTEGDHPLPRPTYIVNSGYGLHLYWVMDRDIPVAQWSRVATALKAVVSHLGIKADVDITADSARVLRPPGTHNYKDAQYPRDVAVLPAKRHPHYRLHRFALAVFRIARAAGLDRTTQRRSRRSGLHSLAARLQHNADVPFSARIMADRCPAFGAMRESQGAHQNYNEWLRCIQTLIHTTECANDNTDLIHEWSRAHPEYDEVETEAKIENVRDGMKPSTCDGMANHAQACATCEHRGKIKSPISLGLQSQGHVTEDPVVVAGEIAGMQGQVYEIPPLPKEFAGQFRWDGTHLVGTRTKYDADGNVVKSWEAPFCKFFFMLVFMFKEDETGDYMVRAHVRKSQGEWRFDDIPLAAIGRGGAQLYSELSRTLGIVSPQNLDLLEKYVRTWAERIYEQTELQTVRRTLGWQEDGSFQLGWRNYRPDGTIAEALLSKSLARQAPSHTPRGSLDRAKELVDQLFNRPNRTAHQVVWMTSFASALVALYDDTPKGLVCSAVSRRGGTGKTTSSLAGISVWGNPYAHGQVASADRITEYALYRMAGERRHLPLLFDETTRWSAEKLTGLAYNYSQGYPKQQGSAEGGLRDNAHLTWQNFLYITANASPTSKIMAENGNSAPMVSRVLEVPFPDEDLRRADEHGMDKMNELLRDHTGVFGHEFIRRLVRVDRGQIREALEKAVHRVNAVVDLGSDGRHWAQAAAFLLTAFKLTQSWGLHRFDKDAFFEAVYDIVRQMQQLTEDSETSAEDVVGQMLADLNTGLIATVSIGNPNSRNDHNYLKNLPNGPVHGRIVTEGPRAGVYLHALRVRRWCSDHQYDYGTVREKLEQAGLLLNHDYRFNLGANTPLATGRVRTWRLSYSRLQQQADDVITMANVHSIEENHVDRTDTPTDEPQESAAAEEPAG